MLANVLWKKFCLTACQNKQTQLDKILLKIPLSHYPCFSVACTLIWIRHKQKKNMVIISMTMGYPLVLTEPFYFWKISNPYVLVTRFYAYKASNLDYSSLFTFFNFGLIVLPSVSSYTITSRKMSFFLNDLPVVRKMIHVLRSRVRFAWNIPCSIDCSTRTRSSSQMAE